MKSFLSGILLLLLVSAAFAQNWQCPITKGNVDISKITSDYGPRNVGSGSWFHLGIDLGYPKGPLIYAVEEGVAYYEDGEHKIVRITHPYRYRDYESLPSRYLHNDTVIVGRPNPERVSRGQLIAYVGNAGIQTPGDYHLLFEFGLYKRPRYQPLSLLSYNNTSDPGPIEFTNLTNGQNVSNLCTVKVRILTTIDKDLNAAVLCANGERVDSISYDPKTPGVDIRNKKVEPQGLGDDIFKFL